MKSITFRFAFIWIIVLIHISFYSQSAKAQVVQSNAKNAAIPEIYSIHGWFQEAAWSFRETRRNKEAKQALLQLEDILRSDPVEIQKWGGGVSKTYILTFRYGTQALFKVDQSDEYCQGCGANREVAAYLIDNLLGFNLTPLTILRRLTLPDSSKVLGSAMYFVKLSVLPEQIDAKKSDKLRLLDAIIGNSDRHYENWLITATGRLVAIDHNRAFQFQPSPEDWTCWEEELDLISDISALVDTEAIDVDPTSLASIFSRYKLFTDQVFQTTLEKSQLSLNTIHEFLKRRDQVLERLGKRIQNPTAPPAPKKACTDL